jgi:hypothetical protein
MKVDPHCMFTSYIKEIELSNILAILLQIPQVLYEQYKQEK